MATLGVAGFVLLIASILSGGSPQEGAAGQPLEAGAPTAPSWTTPSGSGVGFLGYSDKLDEQVYGGTRLGGLSGLAYDPAQNTYYAVVDREAWDAPARFYTLRLPTDDGRLGDPQILGVTFLRDATGQLYRGENFDGEGIAVTGKGELLVASETEPSIRRFSPDGRFLAELPVPPRFRVAPFGQARSNGSFESLSASPDSRSLFTAPQLPLSGDGQSSEGHQRIRVLRYEKRGTTDFKPSEEFFYLTEPGHSLTDIFALSETKLLVLEGRLIFRVSLGEAEDVSEKKSLASSQVAPVEKELLVDLDACSTPGGAEGRRAFPESLELGKTLSSGRQALVVVSDDNFDRDLRTRVIALAVQVHTPAPSAGATACE